MKRKKNIRRFRVNDPLLGPRWVTVRRRGRKQEPRNGTVAVLGYSKVGDIDVDEWLRIPESGRE